MSRMNGTIFELIFNLLAVMTDAQEKGIISHASKTCPKLLLGRQFEKSQLEQTKKLYNNEIVGERRFEGNKMAYESYQHRLLKKDSL